LDDAAFETIGASATLLGTFRVSFCENLSDSALLALAPLTKLRHFQLRKGQGFTDPAFVALFSAPTFGSKLQVLDLSECSQLADSGLSCIATRCSELVSIATSWCWKISDVGFASIVCNCPLLAKVDVTGVKGLKGSPVLSIPELLPNLRILCVKEVNRIQDEELTAVLDAMPQLTVIGFYGESLREELREGDDNTFDTWYATGHVILDNGLVLDF
jgi:hypothetical protein